MFPAVFLYPLFLIVLLLPRPSETNYAAWTTKRHRGKILMMVMELVKDVNLKVKSIQHLRRFYYKHIVYQVGEMIYDIRHKYKRMTFLLHWSETQDKSQKIKNAMECQQLSVDVDKLIHMIEEYESNRAKRSKAHDRVKYILRMKEQSFQKEQDRRDTLRAEMIKIRDSEKQSAKKQRQLEDGFDTE